MVLVRCVVKSLPLGGIARAYECELWMNAQHVDTTTLTCHRLRLGSLGSKVRLDAYLCKTPNKRSIDLGKLNGVTWNFE